MLELKNGDWQAALAPETGGAVARLTHRGRDVLRAAPDGAREPLAMASFPLVPFANRIANGRFRFAGHDVRLPRNFGDHPHVLHGHGWQAPWRVVSRDESQAVLAFAHAADAWPWPYAAEQRFALSADGLRVELLLTSRGAEPMPFSLGFHPYFPKFSQTRLQADVRGVWLSDDACIPTVLAAPAHFLDLARGTALAEAPFVDHCHTGWAGTAVIAQPEFTLRLSASPELDFLHVFVPSGADYFCAEPVSAMPDAFNRAPAAETGLRVLPPGATFAVWMNLAVLESET